MTFPSVEQVRHKNSQTDEELEFIFGRRSELRADRGDGGALSQGDRPSEPPQLSHVFGCGQILGLDYNSFTPGPSHL